MKRNIGIILILVVALVSGCDNRNNISDAGIGAYKIDKIDGKDLDAYLENLPEEAFSCKSSKDCMMIYSCCGISKPINQDYVFETDCSDYSCSYYIEACPYDLECENSKCTARYRC